MVKEHFYTLEIKWTGNKGEGTSHYKSYDRNHIIEAVDKDTIQASSDPAFLGDKTKYNPEELLLASLSSCHMLWFLHLCADNGVIIIDYTDNPKGILIESEDGSGKFKEVILHPKVIVANGSMIEKVNELHHKAQDFCFIANSVNFTVRCEGVCYTG
jgi:organic hydroperoxide reductase OsmC/OhrA